MLTQKNLNSVKNCTLTPILTPIPSSIFWHWNGENIVPFDGRISLLDRGFRYGQHLFETLAVRKGKLLFAEEHQALLTEAAERNKFPFSASWQQALRDFLQNESFADGLLRIYLTAGEGKIGSPIVAPNLLLTWEESLFPTVDELKKGITLATLNHEKVKQEWGIHDGFTTARWGEKDGNYGDHVRALEQAYSMGAQEGIVLSSSGEAVSAVMANLIVWIEPTYAEQTPIEMISPWTRLARRGVVLQWVEKNSNLKYGSLSEFHLKHALAMAITNSRLGVMPVASIDGKKFSQPQLAERLAFKYLSFMESKSCL